MKQLRLSGVAAPRPSRGVLRIGGEAFGPDGVPRITHRRPPKRSPDEEAVERLGCLVREAATFVGEAEAAGDGEAWRRVFVSAVAAGERWLSLPEAVRAALKRNGWAGAPEPFDDPSGGMVVALWLVSRMGEQR